MLTEKMTYTVSAVTPNTQVGDIVYVKELDSGAHAIGEVDRIYAHGVHMDLYMAKRVSENTFEVSRRLYPEFFNMHKQQIQDNPEVTAFFERMTFLPLEQIDEMDKWEGSQLNTAKEILAFELTKLVHGEEEANKAQEAARALFGGSGSSENMPATQLPEARFTDGKIGAIELLVACGLCASNGEARRLIQQGGVAVNDQKVASIDVTFDQAQFAGDGVVIKKGKKVFHRAYTA